MKRYRVRKGAKDIMRKGNTYEGLGESYESLRRKGISRVTGVGGRGGGHE